MWRRWRSAGTRLEQVERQGKNQVNRQHEHTDEPRRAAAVGYVGAILATILHHEGVPMLSLEEAQQYLRQHGIDC
jgi:hypothetical protein